MSNKLNESQEPKSKGNPPTLHRFRNRGSSPSLLYKVILIYGLILVVLISLGRYFLVEQGEQIQDSLPILDLKVSLAGKMATNRARLQLMRSKLEDAKWHAHNLRYKILLDQIDEKIEYYDMSIERIKNVNVLDSYSTEEMKILRAALNESLRSEIGYEDVLDNYQLLVLELMLSVDRQHIETPTLYPDSN
ncbi:hypothetical protein VIBNISOn1_1890028 [Vibrio nigripulchritudo SOn1]|uniref:Uncharacterized protein n=1 Tax=Vibrio nigripulchritudo SOn1 TaxID=1238450 RepID=A0AAV2VQG3_9VIBR|nr:hypothetical protein [Vibrio nigripulchritudo]CCO46780.1 hypothetical protein VIBNISOn1_1890028 [Vibrio nigripulchritudo SOn1]